MNPFAITRPEEGIEASMIAAVAEVVMTNVVVSVEGITEANASAAIAEEVATDATIVKAERKAVFVQSKANNHLIYIVSWKLWQRFSFMAQPLTPDRFRFICMGNGNAN